MLSYEYETSFSSPRIEPELYISGVVIRVYAHDEEDRRFLVGVILADQLAIDCAINDRVRLYEVFDSDCWEYLYLHFFDEDGNEQKEHGFECSISQVIIIYRMFFCDRLKRHTVAVLQALQDFYDCNAVLAINEPDVSARALKDAGFARLGGLDVFVKHNSTVSPYRKSGRNEKYFEIHPTLEDQMQVESMWDEWKRKNNCDREPVPHQRIDDMAMKKRSMPIRAVLYRNDGKWLVHCLEFDLLGTGSTAQEAIKSLSDAIAMQIEFSLAADNPKNLFSPAPSEFFDLFSAGKNYPTERVKLHFPGLDIEEIAVREYDAE